MKTITLTLPEQSTALNAAWLRIITSAASGLNHNSTYERTMVKRIQEEFIGACGELAVAKSAGVFFLPSVNTFHRVPDFLSDYEVRSTDLPGGCLIVRNNDDNERRYILATVLDDVVNLVGWIKGSDAKRQEWLRDPGNRRPSWFVPQASLSPIEEVL
jgi:hypothetical protein